ncbi:MAG: hypothetical protein KBT36_17430 [Kurthia sp.]|nr:hypothetical protein [Candidatus Kurthia equi]
MFQKKWALPVALATVIGVSTVSSVGLEGQAKVPATKTVNYKTALSNSTAYYYSKNLQATYATPDLVTNLARSSYGVNKSFYTNYYKDVAKKLVNQKGILTESAGSIAKTIIAINAIGKNPTNVGGYNLLDILADKLVANSQTESGIGISNAIYTLIALEGDNAQFSTKENYMAVSSKSLADYLISTQFENGGFSWDANVPDGVSVDMTAMVLTALANLDEYPTVKAAIRKGLDYMASNLSATAGYEPWGANSADTQAQVILALTENGMNPKTARAFIKNGEWAISNLLLNYDATNHSFKMMPTDKVANAYTTSSGILALVAYDRYATDHTTYYDVADVKASSLAYDTTPPKTIKLSAVTNAAKKLTGTAEAYAKVVISQDSKKLSTTQTDVTGKFSYTIPTALKAASTVKVTVTDLAGNQSKVFTYKVKDVLTPAKPKVSKVVAGAKIVYGTATKGATVTVKATGKSYKTTANPKTGKYSVKVTAVKKGAKITVFSKKDGYTSKLTTVTVKAK